MLQKASSPCRLFPVIIYFHTTFILILTWKYRYVTSYRLIFHASLLIYYWYASEKSSHIYFSRMPIICIFYYMSFSYFLCIKISLQFEVAGHNISIPPSHYYRLHSAHTARRHAKHFRFLMEHQCGNLIDIIGSIRVILFLHDDFLL